MARSRIYLLDTTLRDGQQTLGIDFSLEDKIRIARMLDELGVDYVEGGYPGANPTDTAFFSRKRTERAAFVAFGMIKRPGLSASNDPALSCLLRSAGDAICLVAKAWDHHVDIALEISLESNLDAIRDSVTAVRGTGKTAMVDCEHFFDGFKANPDYALACARTAYGAGARWVILCDTNGGSQPAEISRIVRRVIAAGIPGDCLGMHAHNDTGQAVSNSLAAVEAGARQIQGTLNGIGERCGNANLVTLIATLALKPAYSDHYHLGIEADGLAKLPAISHGLDLLLQRPSDPQAPYVGAFAFATKAGIHASALLKDPRTYEHVAPERVGNRRRLLVSNQGGRANFIHVLNRYGIIIDKGAPALDRLIEIVKEREAAGYSYEDADASFELLTRRTLASLPDLLVAKRLQLTMDSRRDQKDRLVSACVARLELIVDGKAVTSVAAAEAPFEAIGRALRADLGRFQSETDSLAFDGYTLRMTGKDVFARTRVLVDTTDGDGGRYRTVGVAANIADALLEAMCDAVLYMVLKNRRLVGRLDPVAECGAGPAD